MFKRKIQSTIEKHLRSDDSRILVITGARQIGKTYIIRNIGQSMFKNYVEINMAEDAVGDRLFAEAKTLGDFYVALSSYAGNRLKTRDNTLVFIDEIQTYAHLLTLIKFLRQDNRYTYIASGSLLGVTLKETVSVPVGSIAIVQMYPMDFEEFLWANGVGEEAIESLYEHYISKESLAENMHNYYMSLFKRYLLVGGLPNAVSTYLKTSNIMRVRQIQEEIHHLYLVDAARYEEEARRRLKIQRIYEMIPSNLENKKKRMVARQIEDKRQARMVDYQDEFEYLIHSGIALQVNAISQPQYPVTANIGKNLLKLYMNDVGLFSAILFGNNVKPILEDIRSINLGALYESLVAQELAAQGFRLTYYDNKQLGEVDYLIDDYENMSILPIEVKSGRDFYVHSALKNLIDKGDYNVKRAYVLSNNGKIYDKEGITYLPIYNVIFMTRNTLPEMIPPVV